MPRRGLGRVSFLAKLSSITADLDAGYPMISVYEKHEKFLKVSYAQFTRYIKKYIVKPAIPEPQKKELVALAPTTKPKGSFGEDFAAKPDKDELI